jgi:alpha-tubulin suppressor-like RCC1 family protein
MTGVLAGKIVTSISAGDSHCLALTSEGKIYSWVSTARNIITDNRVLDQWVN